MGNILAISASPRRNGNSELLLQSFIKGVEEEGERADTVYLRKLKFAPCRACDSCAETGKCIIKDDLDDIYSMIAAAKGLVIVTPIYFGSMSAQMKMFVDRFQCWWHAKYGLDKPFVPLEEERPGFFLSVGAMKNKAYSESALAIGRVYFHNVNFRLFDSICVRGVDEKGEINDYQELLEEAREAGRSFAKACRK